MISKEQVDRIIDAIESIPVVEDIITKASTEDYTNIACISHQLNEIDKSLDARLSEIANSIEDNSICNVRSDFNRWNIVDSLECIAVSLHSISETLEQIEQKMK